MQYDGFTRAPGQHPDIFPSSASGVKGAFISALQSRFYRAHTPDESMPWVWDVDPTPTNDDAGPSEGDDPDAPLPPRRIYIGEGGRQYNSARNVVPALLVSRGRIQYVSIGVANVAAHDYPRGGEAVVCHVKLPVIVDCLSNEETESETIADVVASFLLVSDKQIRTAFGLHGIGVPSIEPTAAYKQSGGNVEAWSTQVVVEVEAQCKFWRWPLAPVFNDVRAHIETNGEIRGLEELLQRPEPR